MAVALNLREAEIKLSVPVGSDPTRSIPNCTIVWARPIIDDFFELSIQRPDEGYTLWLARINDKEVTLLSCTLYLSERENNLRKLSEKLLMKSSDIHERILLDRITAYAKETQ